jgi:hypothetical protein
MNKYVYPLNLWTYLPHTIKFTSKIVLIQFTNGTFYILFKQPEKSPIKINSPGDWATHEELDWFSQEKLQQFEDIDLINMKRDLELKEKFNGN